MAISAEPQRWWLRVRGEEAAARSHLDRRAVWSALPRKRVVMWDLVLHRERLVDRKWLLCSLVMTPGVPQHWCCRWGSGDAL